MTGSLDHPSYRRTEEGKDASAIKAKQLNWTVHVTRMSDGQPPKTEIFGELQEGKHSHGGQKKCYKYTLKASLKPAQDGIKNQEKAVKISK